MGKKKSEKHIHKTSTQELREILDRWYQSYIKIVSSIGTASGIVLVYVGLNLIEFINAEGIESSVSSILRENGTLIKTGIILLTSSILSMLFCLISTYNWYITGLSRLSEDIQIHSEELEERLGDSLKYRSMWFNMRIWGIISLLTGLVTGLTFFGGITIYSLGVWDILTKLLRI